MIASVRALIDAALEWARRRRVSRTSCGPALTAVCTRIYRVRRDPFTSALEYEVWLEHGASREFLAVFPTLDQAEWAYPRAELFGERRSHS